jgi:hypothetical protein
MLLTLESAIRSSSEVTQIDVTLSSYSVISDPVAYVQQLSVFADILANAGLDEDLLFISASLESTSSIGSIKYYSVLVTVSDSTSTTVGSHTHDYSTVDLPLQRAYEDGPSIVLTSALGAIRISYTDALTTDFLRITADTTDLLYVHTDGSQSLVRMGTHQEFYPDATFDLGTPDEGVTPLRPRDVRLSRDLYCGRNSLVTGYGDFTSYTKSRNHMLVAQAANPDSSASSRHVYVNSTDDSLRYWDGTGETLIGGTATTSVVIDVNCNSAVSVRDVVWFVGANLVDRASASTLTGKRAVGVCVEKPSATTAKVLLVGEISGYATLTSGSEYFVDTAVGALTNDPVADLSTGNTQQYIGIAKTSDILVVNPGDAYQI